jgi:hypothetical protein
MAKVDLVMWAHRRHPIQEKLKASVEALTSGDFAYHEMIFPANCHVNQNRAFRTGEARYVCILDEDVQVIQREWIWHLIEVMEKDPKAGIVNCTEVKTLADRDRWIHAFAQEPVVSATQWIPWAPAYVSLFDRERTPDLTWDEQIPGRKGMSDVDISLCVRELGLRCVRHLGVCVYHPDKGDEDARRALETTSKREELDVFPAQHEYMVKKWGRKYLEAVGDASSLMPQRSLHQVPAWFRSEA